MKLNRIFKIGTTFILAGFMSFTIASCTNNEDKYTEEDTTGEVLNDGTEDKELTSDKPYGVNDPAIEYDDGEYIYNREYTYEDRDKFTQDARNQIGQIDRELEALEKEYPVNDEENQKAVQEVQNSRQLIERELENLNQRIEELEGATEQNWNQTRDNINQSFEKIEQERRKIQNKETGVDVNTNNRRENQ